MTTDHPKIIIKKGSNEILDDYIIRVLRAVNVPVCINTVSVLTGLASFRVCKILARLERDKKIIKTTNVYHAYWRLI